MWIILVVGVGLIALAHTAAAALFLDAWAPDRAVSHRRRDQPPTVYLTYDDGPNPSTTPALLDVLARERVHATFFLIDEHVNDDTAAIVRRMFAEGHAVAQHSGKRWLVLKSPSGLATTLMTAA